MGCTRKPTWKLLMFFEAEGAKTAPNSTTHCNNNYFNFHVHKMIRITFAYRKSLVYVTHRRLTRRRRKRMAETWWRKTWSRLSRSPMTMTPKICRLCWGHGWRGARQWQHPGWRCHLGADERRLETKEKWMLQKMMPFDFMIIHSRSMINLDD